MGVLGYYRLKLGCIRVLQVKLGVRTKGIYDSSYRPNSGGIKEHYSQIQWPVPSINAEPVDIFLGE